MTNFKTTDNRNGNCLRCLEEEKKSLRELGDGKKLCKELNSPKKNINLEEERIK